MSDTHDDLHADEFAMDSKRVADAYADSELANRVFELAHKYRLYPSVMNFILMRMMIKLLENEGINKIFVEEVLKRRAIINREKAIADKENKINAEVAETVRVFREEGK
jgi:hypothetical protein